MEINSRPTTFDKNKSIELTHRKISKFRNYASQIYATFATNIVKFSIGAFMGYTSVVVAELYKEDAEIHMSISDQSWFSSRYFMISIGCLFLGTLSKRIGSRLTMLISTTFCLVSSLLFYFATNAQMLLGAQSLAGLFMMTSFGPGETYVVEISQPQLRSALTVTTLFSGMTAAFLVVFLSNFLHWRTIALVMLAFPIVGFIAVCTIPESPHWLASKSKFNEAEAALCWLRGWSSRSHVVSEFDALKETYNTKSSHVKVKSKRWFSFKDSISSYLQRSFYVPLLLMNLLFILHNSTGYAVLVIYYIVIFKQINAPIASHVAASICDAMRILGALTCTLSINCTGKKKLVYITLVGAGLTHMTTSMALLLNDYQIYPETCRWIATLAIICTAFLSSSGIDKIVYILNAEVFPTKYRNVGVCISLFVNSVTQTIINRLFLPLWDVVTLSGVFFAFGMSCFVACLFFHFTFPETEGKTLQEIEEHFAGVKKLNNNE